MPANKRIEADKGVTAGETAPQSRITKRYIGDGVYVELKHGMLQLTTERNGRIETVYLEPNVFVALRDFYDDARDVYETANASDDDAA